MEFAHPLVLLLVSPVFLAGWLAIRRGVSKALMLSRMIILSLLIIALASPFTIGMTTVIDDAPRITVISDQTMSMDLFEKDTGQQLFESIKSRTPTTYREFAGISSPIGDEVITAAEGGNNIVLVSDGNNNLGKDLFDAISFVSRTGTRVFAVKQEPIYNDASIEIAGPKNLIIGNENVFNIVVRQAGNETGYRLDVEIDGQPVKSETVDQVGRTRIIPVPYTFDTLGTHSVTARITPNREDRFRLNNVFYKSVFVVPKPEVLAVTDDTGSPLYAVASSLYAVTTANSVPSDLGPYKTVIIDNKDAAALDRDNLRTYVSSGGGLVVVGGDMSYDRGLYNNSPAEAILPIISRAGEFGGGNNIVIVIDASSSTALSDYTGGPTRISLIDANAINMVRNMRSDTSVGVLAFGGQRTEQTGILRMNSEANKAELEDFIREIGPKIGDITTDLDVGLFAAEELLGNVSGSKEIVVLSDGNMPQDRFDQIRDAVIDLTDKDIKIHFVQILGDYYEVKTGVINERYGELARISGEQVIALNPDERVPALFAPEPGEVPTPTPTPEITFEYPLVPVDTEHFITRYINFTASVTGFNDVIPKLGSDELVATSGGKPILTTWGFGLGRVVSFTTDNGRGGEELKRWASQVYSGENSRLISSMINWAIGDPRPKEGVVVQAEDIWGGTPGKVVVTSDTLPQVNLDGSPLDLSRTGQDTYETSIYLEKEGFHDLSGYGIAVNYPLEYREIGFNEELENVIESNGGRVYTGDEVEGLLLVDIKEKSTRTVQEPESEKEPFLLAALILFLGEVIIRRLKDYSKERPLQDISI